MPKLAQKYKDRIGSEGWEDHETYFINLKRGWKNGDDPIGICHGIAESSLAYAYKKVRWAMPCNCKDCRKA